MSPSERIRTGTDIAVYDAFVDIFANGSPILLELLEMTKRKNPSMLPSH